MTPNFPCRGCWWSEGGRCFNDNLGLGKAPRGRPLFSGENGFDQTEAHLAVCAEARAREDRAPYVAKAVRLIGAITKEPETDGR